MTFENFLLTYLAPIGGFLTLAITAAACILGHRDQVRNNELSGCPDFYFTKPNGCSRFGVSECAEGPFEPLLNIACDGKCTTYWFNMVNYGKFVAKNVRIMLATQNEVKNIYDIPRKWISIPVWGGMPVRSTFGNDGELIPIETELGSIRFEPSDKKLYVLVEYTSAYSRRRYKKIFEWCFSDIKPAKPEEIGITAEKTGNNERDDDKDNKRDCPASRSELLQIGKDVYFRSVRTLGATERKFWKSMPRFFTKLHSHISKKCTIDEWLEIF